GVRAKALNQVIPIVQWIDKYTFLTKSGHVGIVLKLRGVNRDCMNDDMAKSFTARFHQVCKGFSDEYQIYQYIVKNGEAEIPVSEHAEMSDLFSPDILRREEALPSGLDQAGGVALPDKVSHHYAQIFA